jgi:subtilisin family serine protease
MVAVPQNGYDFRSGSSLAAAHVSGVVALLLSASSNLTLDVVRASLQSSQRPSENGWPAVNACVALQRIDPSVTCT